MLVYDKSLTLVELPSKWGKFDQFEGGKTSIICKSIRLNLNKKSNLLDAIWHQSDSNECIICLTSEQDLQFFKITHPNHSYKELSLNNYLNMVDDAISNRGLF